MSVVRLAALLVAGVAMAGAPNLQAAGPARAMTASIFDGSRRVVVIAATSAETPAVRGQRAELLTHAAGLDERDMVVFATLSDGTVQAVHGPAPTPAEVRAFLGRNPLPADEGGGRFAVLLVGKDGGVKFRSARPVRAEELFALIDTMPMRRQEMRR